MPTTSKTKPTVGRIVWVWLSYEEQTQLNLVPSDEKVPFTAQVIYADTDTGLATLKATDHSGDDNIIEDVQIFDPEDDDCHGDDESYATWMPYQKAQHDKQSSGG